MTEKWFIRALSKTALSVYRHISSIFIPEFTKRCLCYTFCNRLFWISKHLQGNKGECENVSLEFLIPLFKLSNCQYQAGNKFSRSSFFLHQKDEMSSVTGCFPKQAIIGFIPSKVAFEIRFI